MLDLSAYLERIGLSGRPSPAEVHRAHVAAIPFENLGPHAGEPVLLTTADLERKLVRERRGGYCFEHNLLLKAALEALGADVEMYLARVRWGAPPGAERPRGHLVLRILDGGAGELADVGFGGGTQLEPMPFALGAECEQSGWRYRLRADGPEWVLQSVTDGEWADVYGFLPHPVLMIDVETISWWVSTHPASPFVAGLIVGTQDVAGRRTVLSDWGELSLRETAPGSAPVITPVARSAIPELLAARFALPGFTLDDVGRVRRAA